MSLPVFATEAEIPDAFRPEYEERDGSWHPKIVGEMELERSKRQTLLDEKKAEKAKREAAEARLADAERDKRARDAGLSDDEIKRRQKEIEDAVAAERAKTEVAEARANKVLLTDRVRALCVGSDVGMIPDRLDDDAMMGLLRYFTLSDKDELVVLDGPSGTPTVQRAADFLVTKYKQLKPWLYAYDGGSGSNSGPSRGRAPVSTNPASPVTAQKRATVMGAL